MESAFVTLARFRSLLPAQYYQSLLEENGIRAFLPEEQTVGLCSPGFWFIQLQTRIRLLVPCSERERALAVLREAVEYARATEACPISPDEVFEEEVFEEGPFDMTGPGLLFRYAVGGFLSVVLYWVMEAVAATVGGL